MMRQFIKNLKIYLAALVDPVCWIIDKRAESILDVACGQGLPMRKIKSVMTVKYSLGVDLYKPYLKECQSQKIHNKYLCTDIRNLPFKEKSFEVVLALQILEHLPKRQAWKVLKSLEKIARKQVIISTPIGKCFHPVVDSNKLQLHHSAFLPEELERQGYKVIKAGKKGFADENGIINKFDNNFIKMCLYAINLVIDALTLLFPSFANHYFVAYKSFLLCKSNKFTNQGASL